MISKYRFQRITELNFHMNLNETNMTYAHYLILSVTLCVLLQIWIQMQIMKTQSILYSHASNPIRNATPACLF